MRMAARCFITVQRRSSAPSTRPAANSTASSVTPSADHSSYPQIPRTRHVLNGGKALAAAVKKHAGESAAIQRCQVHKRRNVLDHLTDEQKPAVAKKLNAAYALEDYSAA